VATCNSGTGNCDETLAAAATACSSGDPCRQNEACDANGNCGGVPKPDGNPCVTSACAAAGMCMGGTCTCSAAQPDLSGTVVDSGAPADLGKKGNGKHGGCEVGAGGAADAPSLVWLLLLLSGASTGAAGRARARARRSAR
jgi:hypothetical protein